MSEEIMELANVSAESIMKLTKENEDLKEENEELKDQAEAESLAWKDYYGTQKFNELLKKENDNLEKEIKELKKQIPDKKGKKLSQNDKAILQSILDDIPVVNGIPGRVAQFKLLKRLSK